MTSFVQYNNFQPLEPNMSESRQSLSTMTFESIWRQHRVGIVFVCGVFAVVLVFCTILAVLKRCESRRRNKQPQQGSANRDRRIYRPPRGSKCPDGRLDVVCPNEIVLLAAGDDGVNRGTAVGVLASAPGGESERQSLTVRVRRLVVKLSDLVSGTLTRARRPTDHRDAGVVQHVGICIVGDGDLQQVISHGDSKPPADLVAASG